MQYITGIHALNLPCSLNTDGDWHQSAIQWIRPTMADTDDAFFSDYGIEDCNKVPEHPGTHKIANHIRALLDLLVAGNFGYAQGMKNDFIVDPQYTDEIFQKVSEMNVLPHWAKINQFMGKEYGTQWLRFLQKL